MKKFLVLITVMPVFAFGGKLERERMKEVMGTVGEAKKAFLDNCGCKLDVVVKEEGFKTDDDILKIKRMAERFIEGSKAHCTDAESKKALCNLKTLEMVKSKETAFTFDKAKGRGVASTDGTSTLVWDWVTEKVDN